MFECSVLRVATKLKIKEVREKSENFAKFFRKFKFLALLFKIMLNILLFKKVNVHTSRHNFEILLT